MLPVTDSFFSGPDSETPMSKSFGYYDTTLKATTTGKPFRTFYGLRMYHVTGGKVPELLTSTEPEEILRISKNHKWCFVRGLNIILMLELLHHLKNIDYVHDDEAFRKVYESDNKLPLTSNEQSWLKIVEKVAKD